MLYNGKMENDIAISVRNVSKTFKIPHEKVTSIRSAAVGVFSRKRGYEEFKALDDVSFEVKKGEFFGIIGRNGSGKSTLLKILAGIYQPDKGKIKINGMISPFLELGIGFNPELSGRDNIYLNATVLGMTKKQIDNKFDSIVKFSELERFIDQKLKNYSSGMSVRLAFSVSIHANRDILLMDEVLAVGDSNFQAKCLTEFNKYRDMGRTVIIVTHDVAVVQRYCDRAMLLRNGKIVKIGKSREVGDAYVYENMSDEERRVEEDEKQKIIIAETRLKNMRGRELEMEKRRIAEEKIKQEEERRNKVAEIKKVEFYNAKNELINSIASHEMLEIRISYRVTKKLNKKFNIGLSIASDDGIRLFGCTTEIDDVIVNAEKEFVSIILKSIPLLKGAYFVNITLYGATNKEIFDFRPKLSKFNVYSLGKEASQSGFIGMEYDWVSK